MKFTRHSSTPKVILSILALVVSFTSLKAHEGHGHNHIHTLNSNFQLYQICQHDLEGFASKLSGGEYQYPSLRDDVGQAMIARATTGKMAFEFLSSPVPSTINSPLTSFFFLSDIDLNLREPFDVFINDELLLTFRAQADGTLQTLHNPGQGKASYYLIQRDGNGDGVGAFRLSVPTSWLEKESAARIKVQGHKKGSNSWFMIFMTDDVIERLKHSALHEASFSIRQFQDELIVDAPAHFNNLELTMTCDQKKAMASFKLQGDIAKARFKLAPPKSKMNISWGPNNYQQSFDNNSGIATQSDVHGDYFYHFQSARHDNWRCTFSILHRPSFYQAYSHFFDQRYADGLVAIVNSSHQDIAWVDRPEVCIMLRDTLLLTPIIQDAFQRADYGFDIEDGLMLREYLDRHPEAQQKLSTLLNRKLLSVGATFNCPYEDMYDAEDQVRQLYLGKKWVKKTFGGYDSKVYWNVDVPGKSLQTPQILKKAGVDYMVISRHARGLFHWESPDGSSVFTYSPGHYGQDLIHLSKDMSHKIKYAAEQVVEWESYFKNSVNHTPLLSDQDMLPAIDYSDFINTWNNTEKVKDAQAKEQTVYLPQMQVMTMDDYLPLAEKHATSADTIRGERPNVWVYIHGPAHHDALTASRKASKLLPAAEKFQTIAYLLDPSRMPYPTQRFNEAWFSKIYPDHGWGGHDGDVTDNLFESELEKSRVKANELLSEGLDFIAGRIKTNERKGIPIVLFNSLSWQRTDPVSLQLHFHSGQIKHLVLKTSQGRVIPHQLNDITKHPDGSIQQARLTFIANQLPSIGYTTYYLSSASKEERSAGSETAHPLGYENDYYKVSLTPKGIAQIHDKTLGKDLLKTDQFMGGDIITLQSVGNGAGEFGDIQQPFMNDYDQLSLHSPGWIVVESGPVFTKYRMKHNIRHAVVEQDVTFYHHLKKIEFDTRLLNWTGELYREFRTTFPLAMNNAQMAHEVPFGRVRVGLDEIKTAGERYTPLCKDVHPRAIIDWISASDQDMSVVLSSSVAAADWIDPTKDSPAPVLQHLLLASRTSCHWEGNEYSQGGRHNYNHMLTSGPSGDLKSTRMAKQHNEPIWVVLNPEQSTKASLPEEESFFSINRNNVIISTIKKGEDNEHIIVRLYETEGNSSQVELQSAFRVNKLQKTNIIEEKPSPVNSMELGQYAIETFQLEVGHQ
jgi:alpha-mannosidase